MRRLAVFFPGIGYHCDKPLLYFSRELAREAGYQDMISLSYACPATDLRGNPEKMRQAGLALYTQAEEALGDIRWEESGEVLFVSKSVGTAIAAAYARDHGVSCRNVFYTPVGLTFGEGPKNGIAFTGTGDPWVDTETVKRGCQAAGIPLTVIENANHSLETADPMENLRILADVMARTRRYIRQE